MLKLIIVQASQTLHNYFDPEQTNQAARLTSFVKRTSKLDGFVFLKALVLGFLQHPQASLCQLSQVCLDLGVSITPQGIDERLNEAAVKFLQVRLAGALANWQSKHQRIAHVLENFTEVYLQDSTIQSLPEGLRDQFPGAGGNASAAAVKIQLLFGFLSGCMVHLEIHNGLASDTRYQAHIPHLLPGSLLIQDLGFFVLAMLQAVASQGAFFLSRWKADLLVFLAEGAKQPVEMVSFLKRQVSEVAEYEVYLGQRTRMTCRMVSVRLPQRVASQRRRRLKAGAKRRGISNSGRNLALCDWMVFVTNLPEDRLSFHQILACYNLRWQVELIFKLWKSQAGLKYLGGLRRERVLCELYAKLIGLVLTHFLIAPLRFFLIEQQVEISMCKAWYVLQDRAKALAQVLGVELFRLETELDQLTQRILRFARKNKRKKHLSSFSRLVSAQHLTIEQLYPLA
jgi:hypothetical protein